MSNSLRPHELQHSRLLCPWDFPGKNTGVGCHFLLIYIYTLWSRRSQTERAKNKGRKRVKRPLQLSKSEVLNAWIRGAARSIEMRKWIGCYLRSKLTWPWWLLRSMCFISALVPVCHKECIYSISSHGNQWSKLPPVTLLPDIWDLV